MSDLQIDRLRRLGIPSGPLLGRLKNGETVTPDDGRLIDGKEYLLSPRKGRIIAVSGDTEPRRFVLVMAGGADVLMHEVALATGDEVVVEKAFHSAVFNVANLATEAGVRQPCLAYISTHYADGEQRQVLEQQA